MRKLVDDTAVRTPAGAANRCRAHSIDELRRLARRRLPLPVFDFADGGAESEWTLRRNESAFDRHAFMPRPMNGPATRDISLTLFGQRLSLPVLIGPTGLAGLFWPNGEIEAARAAHEAGTVYCLSHGSVCSLEQLADAARPWPVAEDRARAPRWMQVFVYNDLDFTWELTDRAAAAGYDALVLTIDNQLLGNRERDVRNGFTIPPRFDARFVWAMAQRLPWLWQMRQALPGLTFGNYVRPGAKETVATLAGRMATLLDPGLNWGHLRELRRRWSKPLILKGVLAPDEALQAARLGVDAIVVSNHGGRQLDGAISSIEALPAIVAALAEEFPRLPILLDGGVRRGTDVVKAIALGATAVLVGRPQLFGLAAAGHAGVARMLEILRTEIDRTMGLVGAHRLADLGPSALATTTAPWSRGADQAIS
jgi:isopentenyl diphosphate isomerase/L-lactate dehydrogenase-like FMN-dependent dehydrogenase